MRVQVGKTCCLLILGCALASCGSNGDQPASAHPEAAHPAITETITQTRAQCTPFGNAPRPRNDSLNDLETGPTMCQGGSRLSDWKDNNGTTRRACLYDTDIATPTHKLPLLVFLQGSAVPSDFQLPITGLPGTLTSANLSNDPQRPGFILLQPIGRITDHFYPEPNNTQTVGWDVWYRQLVAVAGGREVNGIRYPLNADMETVDHYIDQMVATGRVDTDRIYVVGWSNGAALALLYGQNRPRVAAVTMYSGPDPYDSLSDTCGQKPVRGKPVNDTELQVFNPDVPVFHVQNNCDIYASCPNGLALRDKLLAGGTANIRHQIISGMPEQAATDTCMASCGSNPRGDGFNPLGTTIGIANHLVWPAGWNQEMFSFLRSHKLEH